MLIMKNSLIILLAVIFCGKAYALPQDWSCSPFILKQASILSQNNSELESEYTGTHKQYSLSVNVFWQLNPLHSEDDCGIAGCSRTITDNQTTQTENLRFFCETENSANLKALKCYINNNEEYLLSLYKNNEYRTELCGTYYKTVDINKCEKCSCLVKDYRDPQYSAKMNCLLENNKLHCMTGNTYSEKYFLKNTVNDYEKFVGLKISD